MRVVLSTFGSRGDVEPLAALAAQVIELGGEAVVCAPPEEEFAALLERAGVALVPSGQTVRQLIADARAEGHPNGFPQRVARMMAAQYEAVLSVAEPGGAVVSSGLMPAVCGARSAADKLGLRYETVRLQPTTLPSPGHLPHPYPGRPLPEGVTDNAVLWEYDRETMNLLFGVGFNAHRQSVGLPPVEDTRAYVNTAHPWLAADPLLAPWLGDPGVVQTGAWILADDRPLPPGLEEFLAAGDAPVYVGFGSMALDGSPDAARIAIDAVRAHGHRVVLAAGWAGLALIDAQDDCFSVGEVNQQALFARCAAVVHHGGAGTTTTAARAAAPQVVVPQVVDQPYFGGRVSDLGIGALHDGPVATVESLSAALKIVLAPAVRERAAEVASLIRTDGVTVAAGLLLTSSG